MTEKNNTQTKRVMSGMRPTGRLHLGHWLGVLENWVKLQENYECYFMVADWHALTTKCHETDMLIDNIYDVTLDWLATGVDPKKSTMYVQSLIPESAELHLLFSMFTPVKWVETDPTLKDMVQLQKTGTDDGLNYGLLGYPILQTVDILAMKGSLVPIGKDQEAHLEVSRDIAKRINHLTKSSLFPEPKPLYTENSRLIGLDGRKMSKSYDNAIYLSDDEDATFKKVKSAMTDNARVKRDDPGNPKDCIAVFPYYETFGTEGQIKLTAQECQSASRGCMDCKKGLTEILNETLKPMRDRRKTYADDRAQVEEILRKGSEKAREECVKTLDELKAAMKLFR